MTITLRPTTIVCFWFIYIKNLNYFVGFLTLLLHPHQKISFNTRYKISPYLKHQKLKLTSKSFTFGFSDEIYYSALDHVCQYFLQSRDRITHCQYICRSGDLWKGQRRRRFSSHQTLERDCSKFITAKSGGEGGGVALIHLSRPRLCQTCKLLVSSLLTRQLVHHYLQLQVTGPRTDKEFDPQNTIWNVVQRTLYRNCEIDNLYVVNSFRFCNLCMYSLL